MQIRNSKAVRLPQTKPSPVRIARTKALRAAYTNGLSLKSDLQLLIEEMNPEDEKAKLVEMLLRDLEEF